jgi:hypothetical protein
MKPRYFYAFAIVAIAYFAIAMLVSAQTWAAH